MQRRKSVMWNILDIFCGNFYRIFAKYLLDTSHLNSQYFKFSKFTAKQNYYEEPILVVPC